MRYFYERPETYKVTRGATYACDADLYSKCTLYKSGEIGLAVVQKRYNRKLKVFWWGPIDPWLVDDIFKQERFEGYFSSHAEAPDDRGIFPTVNVRSCMYNLGMKPLQKQFWEINF